MPELEKCRACGVDIQSNAPFGHCPQCLLAMGFGPIPKEALEPPVESTESLPPASPEPRANSDTESVSQSSPALADTSKPGDRIGRYKLLEKIGEGGFGIVYMAEQEEPVRRRVAFKILKLGMDTREVIARFEAERQALALMDHPHIARIFDGGATDTGRPYFVMELVRGIRITEYCDQKNLSTRQRLELFMQVCQAVQHAHQKGVIHRDLKPSNILVTVNDGVAVPKVIDFGIAKATGQRLTDKTLFTKFHQIIGTPTYMSPEQAEMTSVDIDTRSDIYSLGVLLYELLTGRTPFDTKALLRAGFEEMLRTIREKEPAKPSARLSTLAAADLTTVARQRQTEAPKLIRLLRGDLDWIVMMCLEKERSRRYETANGLATDVQWHLNNEPVLAGPPTLSYRAHKFLQRNRGLVATTACITAVLILGVVVSAWQWRRAEVARDGEAQQRKEADIKAVVASKAKEEADTQRARAEQEAANVKQTERFIKLTLDDLAATVAITHDTLALEEVLANGVNRLRNELKDQPLVQAELLRQMAMMYSEIKQQGRAESLLREAGQLLRSTTASSITNSPDTAVAANLASCLGRVLVRQAKWAEAEAVLNHARALTEGILVQVETRPAISLILRDLLEAQRQQQHFDDAEKSARKLTALSVPSSNDWMSSWWPTRALADVLEKAGKTAESERVWREMLVTQINRSTNYTLNQFVTETRRSFVEFLIRTGNFSGAETLLFGGTEEALRCDQHRELADVLIHLAWESRTIDLSLAGRCAEKAESLTQSDLTRTTPAPASKEYLALLRGHAGSALLARALIDPALTAVERSKRIDDARVVLDEFLEQCEFAGLSEAGLLRDSHDLVPILGNIGLSAGSLALTHAELAERWRQRAAELSTAIELRDTVEQLNRDGRWSQAEETAGAALAAERQAPTFRHVPRARLLCLLAKVLREQQKFNDAEALLVEAYEIVERLPNSATLQSLVKDSLQDIFTAYRDSPPRTPRGLELSTLFRSEITYNSIRAACVNNQLKIHAAKKKWARDYSREADATPTALDLYGPHKYLQRRLECRGGGMYTIGPVKEPPFCSVHGPACNWVPLGAYDLKWTIYTRGDAASEKAACRDHRLQVDEAKKYWARENNRELSAVPKRAEIFGPERRIKSDSKCPSGGSYTIGAVNEPTRCSVHGTSRY
jgi:serine/threonine protein kinase/tetratricopeptide (TPR) repeat protein